jgi:iron complex outermembrane receptor protein
MFGLGASGEAPEYADNPSAFTTVIDATEYDDRFETVADLLGHVAGVRVRRYGGLGTFSTASVRGAKSEQVLVLLDGVRLNSVYRGDVDLSTLPLRMVERIEVVRGGGGARYGSEAIGGVIAIKTRSAEAAPGWDVSGVAGEHGTLGGDVLLSMRRGSLSTVLAYDRMQSDNDFRFERTLPDGGLPVPVPRRRHTRLGADFLKQTGLATFEWETDANRKFSATVDLHKSDAGQPGNTFRAPVDAPDDKISCPSAEETYRRGVARVAFTDRAAGPGSFEGALFHRFEVSELDDPHGLCGQVVPGARGGRDSVGSTGTESGIDLRYAVHDLRLGPVVLRGRTATAVRAQSWRGDEADDAGRWISTFFVQEEIALFGERLRIVPALGFEAARTRETKVRDPATGAPVDVRPDDDPAWLPRIGAILRIAPGVHLKSTWERSYRRPSFQELFLPDLGFVRGNPRLDPEESWSFDVGLELTRRRAGPLSDLRLEGVWFHRDLDDPIEFVQADQFTFVPRNLPSSRVRGVEIQGSATLADRLDLGAAYTFLDAEVRSTGTPLPHRPRNRLSVTGSLRAGPARLWGDLMYEDEVPLTTTGRLTAPEATQIDVGVTLHPRKLRGLGWVPAELAVSFEWINVTDEQRIDSLGLPLPGRTWLVRMRMRER